MKNFTLKIIKTCFSVRKMCKEGWGFGTLIFNSISLQHKSWVSNVKAPVTITFKFND